MPRSDGGLETHPTKPRFFSGRWLKQLWAGLFSFGDTFFVGLFGPAFVFVPIGVVIAGFLAVVAPSAMAGAIVLMIGLCAVYFTATLPAVIKTGLSAKSAGGWRWFGIVLAGAATIALWGMAYKYGVAL